MPRQMNSLNWFDESEIDYFSAFIKLWLAFNALYKRFYQNSSFGGNDRKYIEAIKTDNNLMKGNFIDLYDKNSDDGKEFRVYLGELVKTYDGGVFGGKKIINNDTLRPQINGQQVREISFKDFIHPKSFSLKRKPRGFLKVGPIYVKDNPESIWPYYVEIVYMIRNQLVHGDLEPSPENHKIIKACYYILYILIGDLV